MHCQHYGITIVVSDRWQHSFQSVYLSLYNDPQMSIIELRNYTEYLKVKIGQF